ncbi:MAG TPA: hypothetical protein VHX86_06310 [Tepidisphaeraceae bacterium]|jgi:hypothetical protein|nr:hypothetical protein [Tepidisphaeraceae bacterium]
MQRYRPIIAINIVALLILCVFVVHFAGFRGGDGQATAGNVASEVATAKDATDKATTGSAVAADDAVTGTATSGSPDLIFNFAGEKVTVTPFIPDFHPEDYARNNLVDVHRDVNPDNGEFYDGVTGQLWAVSITTQAVYEVEQLYLNAQHRRLYMKTISKQGEPARWGYFPLSDGFACEMEQARKLELTTGDGVRRIFVLAGSSEVSGK